MILLTILILISRLHLLLVTLMSIYQLAILNLTNQYLYRLKMFKLIGLIKSYKSKTKKLFLIQNMNLIHNMYKLKVQKLKICNLPLISVLIKMLNFHILILTKHRKRYKFTKALAKKNNLVLTKNNFHTKCNNQI